MNRCLRSANDMCMGCHPDGHTWSQGGDGALFRRGTLDVSLPNPVDVVHTQVGRWNGFLPPPLLHGVHGVSWRDRG